MLPVRIRPWVLNDVSQALQSRTDLGRVLLDLHHHLPNHLARYQHQRFPRNPRCFRYDRMYVVQGKVYGFEFAVRDADPTILDILWVIVTV